jgi:hypothetical protein
MPECDCSPTPQPIHAISYGVATGIGEVLQEISESFSNPQTDDERLIYYGSLGGQFICSLVKILVKSDLCDPDSVADMSPPRGISRRYTPVSKNRSTALDKAIIRFGSDSGYFPVN